MTSGAHLLPNLSAEEGEDWRSRLSQPAVTTTLQLWRWLFGQPTRVLERDLEELPWPDAFGERSSEPAFDWLENSGGFVPWLRTPEASAHPAGGVDRGADRSLSRAVMRVHDKAFAHRVALDAGLLPGDLGELIAVLEPETLRDPDLALATIEQQLARWPEWTGRRFTLKPRFGSSGRGRVAGAHGRADVPEVRGALARLADRGGALLEPWLDRSVDLSAQLHVSESGEIRMLGTLELITSASGLPLGHRGGIDSKGRVNSENIRDEAMREAAVVLARAAHAEGFHGPCGVDGFAYRGPDGRSELRPVVEFNARFTLGIIALGLLRRGRGTLNSRLGLEPGIQCYFHFGLEAPAPSWEQALVSAGDAALLIPLWRKGEKLCPAILFATRREALDPIAAAARSRSA
ncbi:MAG: hypothetical protein V3T33_05665 [Myxococcota bacterium]